MRFGIGFFVGCVVSSIIMVYTWVTHKEDESEVTNG